MNEQNELTVYQGADGCYVAFRGKEEIAFVCFEEHESDDSPRPDSPDVEESMSLHCKDESGAWNWKDSLSVNPLSRQVDAINMIASEFDDSTVVYAEGGVPRDW